MKLNRYETIGRFNIQEYLDKGERTVYINCIRYDGTYAEAVKACKSATPENEQRDTVKNDIPPTGDR